MKILKIISGLIFLMNVITHTGCSETTENISDKKEGDNIKLVTDKNLNKNIYDITVMDMDGNKVKLSDYKGKVLMIVNVASKCGFTKQYEGLENIYKKYNDQGFEILAFPCNDFGEQEPGNNDEIRTFCESKYNVTFKLFDKVKVLGDDKNELYKRLTENSDPAGDISWNFEKFIIDKNGNITERFKSKVEPESETITTLIETKLSE